MIPLLVRNFLKLEYLECICNQKHKGLHNLTVFIWLQLLLSLLCQLVGFAVMQLLRSVFFVYFIFYSPHLLAWINLWNVYPLAVIFVDTHVGASGTGSAPFRRAGLVQWWELSHWVTRSRVRSILSADFAGGRLASVFPFPRPHSCGSLWHWVCPFLALDLKKELVNLTFYFTRKFNS